MGKRPKKTPLELAARALCRLHGLPEDTRYQGAKMWHSQLGGAMDILRAALPPEDCRRLVLDQPWPDPVPKDRQEPGDGADS